MPRTKNRATDGTRQTCWEEALQVRARQTPPRGDNPGGPLCWGSQYWSAHSSALWKGHSEVAQFPQWWPEVPATLHGSGPREGEGPCCPERRIREPLARGEGWRPSGTLRPPALRIPHVSPCSVCSTRVQNLILRNKTIKLIEENIGVTLHDFGFGYGFLDTTPKAQAAKEK